MSSGYPKRWEASTDPADKTGMATYTVEGVEYQFRLDSFVDFLRVDEMLEDAFGQGKRFAAKVMESHILLGIEKAISGHGL